MANVRGDSRICIQDPTGTIRTVIFEGDFERGGYKTRGWKPVKEDWTKDRVIKPPVDYTAEMELRKLGSNA